MAFEGDQGKPPGKAEEQNCAERSPLTEEQIRAHTLGEPQQVSGKIEISEYSTEWPAMFKREEAHITAALGSRALRIEHTGSTSVPGLAAKPVIDLLLAVADSADEGAYVPALERAGYVLRIREPEWHEHRMFNRPGAAINLHVFSSGCAEIERVLLFRDWLRNNPADRDVYARTKRSLATKEWKYVQNYADAKSAVVEQILERARRSRQ